MLWVPVKDNISINIFAKWEQAFRIFSKIYTEKYPEKATELIQYNCIIHLDGFKYGFDIGYEGPDLRKDESKNIPFREVGSTEELWEKVMKEVSLGRYAGPYEEVPYEFFMQSPIGLVPKAGNKTRLIFHLSYEFKSGNPLLNAATPVHKCSVCYPDMDWALQTCFALDVLDDQGVIYFAKTDVQSAFRVLLLNPNCQKWLLMKEINPEDKKTYYFVEKYLPFGASISCSHFQCFSNTLRHIFESKTGLPMVVTNYLDDFLFVATIKEKCDKLVSIFLEICSSLGVPISQEKTEWGSTQIVFLGLLLDGMEHRISIPQEKIDKATKWLNYLLDKKKLPLKSFKVWQVC